jgi:hypothetical protein
VGEINSRAVAGLGPPDGDGEINPGGSGEQKSLAVAGRAGRAVFFGEISPGDVGEIDAKPEASSGDRTHLGD